MEIESRIFDTINRLILEVKTVVRAHGGKVVVAFSGGMDSSLAAIICREAIGTDNVELAHVTYGPFTYARTVEIVQSFASRYGFRLTFIENLEQPKVWRYGPSCNMCTRRVKMDTVLKYASGKLVVTGSNCSDSWGQTGLKLFRGTYAPLGDLEKDQIRSILEYFGVQVDRIGENRVREGCKLKHLLKPLTNLNYHGLATAIANELILKYFPKDNDVANVKIVGPLSKNVAIVNLKPWRQLCDFINELRNVPVIDEVYVAEKPLVLTVVANPSIFRVPESRRWIEEGRLKPEFAVPIKVEWFESKNNKLRTFHVVEVREWTSYGMERGACSESSSENSATSSETRRSCSQPCVTHPTLTN